MENDSSSVRQGIIDACLSMERLGINQGTSGNISVRCGDGMLITPTSLPYEGMLLDDIVYVTMDGTPRGRHRPSSEWRFHRDIYAERPDISSIVHAHPACCTMLAIMGRDIPAVHYMIAAFGGATVRCAPYALFGTADLSNHALKALRGRKACLLGHHGMIAAGKSLAHAMWLSVELETLARQYHGCLQIGDPPILSDAEIDRVIQQMNSGGYGASPSAREIRA